MQLSALHQAISKRPKGYRPNPDDWEFNKGDPTWQWIVSERVVKNQLLVHFSRNAQQIVQTGFKGTADANQLAWTVTLNKNVDGYNFAYLANSNEVKQWLNDGGYGRDLILFRADGLLVYHEGDQEYQVIFWGPDVSTDRMILVRPTGNKFTASGLMQCSGTFDQIVQKASNLL